MTYDNLKAHSAYLIIYSVKIILNINKNDRIKERESIICVVMNTLIVSRNTSNMNKSVYFVSMGTIKVH